MSRNGSGGYNLPTNSWNPAVNGVSATPADWQNLINDVATAIQQSVSADGQTPITGNINMNNNKFTGLAAGNATGNSLRWEQLFSQGVEQDIASAATTDIGLQNTNFLRITGTTTITSFGTNYNGPRFIRFAEAVTLTHSATLQLPYSSNITTTANDYLIVIPKSTSGVSDGWKVVSYQYSTALLARQSVGIPYGGYRNLVVNGGFAYGQRFSGASQTITAGAALKYVADRFFVYCAGVNITANVITTIGGKDAFQITGTSISTTATGVGTRLPQSITKILGVEPMTLSVRLLSSGVRDVTWSIYTANTTNAFGTIAAPTKTLRATGTFNATSTDTQFSANFTLAGGGSTGVEILFTTTALGSAETLQFSNIQLERGTIANENIVFDQVDPVLERQRCMHYYARTRVSARSQANAGGQAFSSSLFLPVPMQRNPTITYVTGTGSILNATQSISSDYRSGRFEVVSGVAGDCYALEREFEFDAEMYT